MDDVLAAVGRLFERTAIPYAIIGGHAVNAWVEPRVTGDVDVTVQAGGGDLDRLSALLFAEGFAVGRIHGGEQPSGPDFVRFVSSDGLIVLEIQTAKTAFQVEVVRRAVVAGTIRVATREDLIVLKLIANRPKDQADLLSLCALPGLDWDHIVHWAEEWGVRPLLEQLRRMA